MDEELNSLIQKVTKFLEKGSPDTESYEKTVRVLKELYGIRSLDRHDRNEYYLAISKIYEARAKIHEVKMKKDSKTMDILAILVPSLTSLLGIGLILFKEEYHPVVSKALGFVYKGRF